MKNTLLFTLLLLVHGAGQNDWRKIQDSNGILTFQKHDSNGILEVKGVAIVDASIDVTGNIFREIDLHPKWVGYCEKSEILEIINRNHYIFYQVLSPPWPVTKRDLVIDSTSDYYPEILAVMIESRSTEIPKKPESKSLVRIRDMKARLWIEYISQNKTGISYEILVNPGGGVPEFLTNIFNQVYIYQNMANLRLVATDEIYTRRLDSADDSVLLNKLLKQKSTMKNTLSNRLSRYIQTSENIDFLINDEKFMNSWIQNKNRISDYLFLGIHDPKYARETMKIIIENYLERFELTAKERKHLSTNLEIHQIFQDQLIKDALTQGSIEKILSTGI